MFLLETKESRYPLSPISIYAFFLPPSAKASVMLCPLSFRNYLSCQVGEDEAIPGNMLLPHCPPVLHTVKQSRPTVSKMSFNRAATGTFFFPSWCFICHCLYFNPLMGYILRRSCSAQLQKPHPLRADFGNRRFQINRKKCFFEAFGILVKNFEIIIKILLGTFFF